MSDPRVAIPAEVARQLRQESGFGCCFCGHPFIQFHHIVPWSVEKHYRASDMMTVCGNHHDLINANAISIEEQREAKGFPKNIVEGLSRGRLYITNPELIVRIGPALAINTPELISFRDKPIVQIRRSDDDRILVSALIQDRSGQIIAAIKDNEWYVPVANIWDFEVKPKQAAVRLARRDIAFGIDARDSEILVRGNWCLGGMDLSFGPKGCVFGSNNIFAGTARNCRGFIGLG